MNHRPPMLGGGEALLGAALCRPWCREAQFQRWKMIERLPQFLRGAMGGINRMGSLRCICWSQLSQLFDPATRMSTLHGITREDTKFPSAIVATARPFMVGVRGKAWSFRFMSAVEGHWSVTIKRDLSKTGWHLAQSGSSAPWMEKAFGSCTGGWESAILWIWRHVHTATQRHSVAVIPKAWRSKLSQVTCTYLLGDEHMW